MFFIALLGLSSLTNNVFAAQKDWVLEEIYPISENPQFKQYNSEMFNYTQKCKAYVNSKSFKKTDSVYDCKYSTIRNITSISAGDYKSQFMIDQQICLSKLDAKELKEKFQPASMFIASKNTSSLQVPISTSYLPIIIKDYQEDSSVVTAEENTPKNSPDVTLVKPIEKIIESPKTPLNFTKPEPFQETNQADTPKLTDSSDTKKTPNRLPFLIGLAAILGIAVWKFDTISEYFSHIMGKIFLNPSVQK